MRLFEDPTVKDFRKQVTELNKKLASMDVEQTIEAKHETAKVLDELRRAQQSLETVKIQQDRENEEFARKTREIEHKIGLEKKRMEFEREEAEKNARLGVREENLKHEKDRFEQEMKFMRERMEHEVDQMKDMLGKVMEMVPTVNVDRRIREDYKVIEGGPTNEPSDS